MRLLILLTMLAAAPAHASELWCMPDKICRNDACRTNTNTESSVRLNDMNAANPILRSGAEDVAMTKTHDAGVVQWQGQTAFGATEILAMRKSDMTFTMISRGQTGDRIATGLCEVQ